MNFIKSFELKLKHDGTNTENIYNVLGRWSTHRI